MKRLKSLRLKRGVTQNELGDKIDMHQSDISKLESGESNPTLKTINRYCNALDYRLVLSFKDLKSES